MYYECMQIHELEQKKNRVGFELHHIDYQNVAKYSNIADITCEYVRLKYVNGIYHSDKPCFGHASVMKRHRGQPIGHPVSQYRHAIGHSVS